ncbi:MAG: NAD(P)H-dependent glycerol-3-phosphate dehydrogenase [Psychrilyobacter sp.]|nr:NAD(P)H-dependent glycerol-3-phosphate dehydrogenase [Psychrilyobacter sp.]
MGKVVVMGAGSWGTALARVIASKGNQVILWDYNEERAKFLQESRVNSKFLSNAKFPETLEVKSDIKNLLEDADFLVMAVPSQVLRKVISKVSDQLTSKTIIINTAKGIEISTGMRLSQVLKDEILGKYHKNIVILSGPTHAEEVAKGLPSTIVAAGEPESAKKVQELFNTETFRVYESNDIIGVELGGAVKNGIAIAAGVADGIGFGDNTKAALITRGLAEMVRFGEALGAKKETFSGLTGMGDLIVTCASTHSRNRHVGQKLGEGKKLKEILEEMEMVAEGVPTVKAVYELAQKLNVSMPIFEGVYKVLYEDKLATEMVKQLMNRGLKREF